jgi:voltage-gated potassium channel
MRWLLLGGAWLPVSIALQQAAPARPRRTLVPGSSEGAWRGSHARPRTSPLRAVDDDFADKAAYNPGAELVAPKETSATEGPQDRAQRRAAEYLANPRFEVFSALITLLSCAAFAIDTLSDLPDIIGETAPLQEGFASVFFLVEYLARFYSRGFDPRFPLEALNVVDLVSFLPLLVNDNSYSFLRLLRVLRLQRLLTDVETFAEVREALGLSSTFDRSRVEVTLQLARVFSSLFTLLFVASGLIYAAESGANAQISDFFDALYFGLTTLTTVGFGDITPVTPAGRFIVSASTILGIAIVPLQLTGLAETILKDTRSREAQQKPPRAFRVDRLSRRCEVCSEKAHRRDAGYCWRCGTELSELSGADAEGASAAQN